MNIDFLKEITADKAELIDIRRDFHRHPDMTGHEEPTIERIAGYLKSFGIDHEVIKDGGLFGYIYGEGYRPHDKNDDTKYEDGTTAPEVPTVMLRADVDALPVQESESNLNQKKVCLSDNPGLCHACGHDSHIAMLLMAAKHLALHKDQIKGRVILFFERGEEGPNNIIFVMRRITETKLHIDTVYGCHIYYALESGKISIKSGPVMAGGVFYKVTLTGRGGHGSRPDMAANPIDCFMAVQNELNEFRMKHVDPFHALTYAPCFVHSGKVDNVIPGDLSFGGNLRLYEPEDGVAFKKFFMETLERTCPLYGCTYTVEYLVGPKMPVKNDPACAALARDVIGKAVGEERIVQAEPWMACESICGMLAMYPGAFSFVGTKNAEKGAGALHHSPEFDIDEDVMPLGATAAAAYAVGFLADPPAERKAWFAGTPAEFYEMSGYNEGVLSMLKNGTPYTIKDGNR